MPPILKTHFILYVSDQEASKAFYEATLACPPTLHVPGMTEFTLNTGVVLGLMPERGIAKLLDLDIAQVSGAGKIRGELYLLMHDPASYHARAIAAGAKTLSPLLLRDWGDMAAYSLDPDGYVLAFAHRVEGLQTK